MHALCIKPFQRFIFYFHTFYMQICLPCVSNTMSSIFHFYPITQAITALQILPVEWNIIRFAIQKMCLTSTCNTHLWHHICKILNQYISYQLRVNLGDVGETSDNKMRLHNQMSPSNLFRPSLVNLLKHTFDSLDIFGGSIKYQKAI